MLKELEIILNNIYYIFFVEIQIQNLRLRLFIECEASVLPLTSVPFGL